MLGQEEFLSILRHGADVRQRISRCLAARQRHHQAVDRRRGFVLVTAYFGVAMLSTLGLAYFGRLSTDHALAQRHVNHARALHYAEAGLDYAIRELATDPDYTGTASTITVGNGGCAIVVTTDDEDDELRRVKVTGSYPGPDAGTTAVEQDVVHAMLRVQIGKFNWPVFADTRIAGGGTVQTDAYDGADGYYGEIIDGQPNSGFGGADMGTNGTSTSNPQAIDINGSGVEVNGDVYCGVGCDTEAAIDLHDWAQYGDRKQLKTPVDMIDYAVPPELPATGAVLDMSGGTVVLDSSYPGMQLLSNGKYGVRFAAVSLTGNAVVQVANGNIEVYVDGASTIKGSNVRVGDIVSGAGRDSTKLTWHANAAVDFGGGAKYCGVLNAPTSAITLSGTSDVYGAMMADIINLSGASRFHFDQQQNPTNGEDAALVELVVYYNDDQPMFGGGGDGWLRGEDFGGPLP